VLSGWKQPHRAYNLVGIHQMVPPDHMSNKQAYMIAHHLHYPIHVFLILSDFNFGFKTWLLDSIDLFLTFWFVMLIYFVAS